MWQSHFNAGARLGGRRDGMLRLSAAGSPWFAFCSTAHNGCQARRRSTRSASPTAIVLERLSTSLEPLLSNIPYPTFSAINIYGVGSEHPFKNYWTLSGGLVVRDFGLGLAAATTCGRPCYGKSQPGRRS